MMTNESEIFVQQHLYMLMSVENGDTWGKLRTREESRRFELMTRDNHTGFVTRIAVATGEVLISLGQKLKGLGMTNSPLTTQMH